MPSNSPFLFPRVDTGNDTLALRPLLIAGMHRPLVDGDGGINIAVMTEHADGMLCVINAYMDMKAGDKHVIYWETLPIFDKEVEPEEVDQPLFFFLPTAHVKPGWIEACYYQLTRAGESTPDDPSVPLRLLVKLSQPGGRDNKPHLPDGHSELRIVQLPPELIEQGVVDAEWAKKGVPITIPFYPEIALRDTILVRWGSTTLQPHLVTQEQVNGTVPIVIMATQDDILAGGDSNALVLRYDIHDEVWNWAVRHSQSTRIHVDAGAWRLEPPIIKNSINGTIILKDLNKEDVTVQVHVQTNDFDKGDTITMTWIGTPPAGKPLIHTESKTVDNIPSIMEFKVPYADVRAIAMGQADASYVLTKQNNDKLSSKRTLANVVGDVSMLPEPAIRELLGDTLEPDEPHAIVDVRYPGMDDGDLVNLIWLGTRSNGQPYPHEEEHIVTKGEAENKLITFYVSNEHISVLGNGRLDLSYKVSNDKVALYGVSESERLLVKVEKVRATLPIPKVEEADPFDVLDPSKMFDVVHVRVEHPGTVKDDILTYYWRGTSPLGSTGDWLPITSVTEGEPVRFRVAAQFVTANIGQYVKVRYTVKHAATGLWSYSVTLNLLIGYQVGDLPSPEVDEAPKDVLDPMHAINGVNIKASYESMDSSLDTIGLKWRGTPGPGSSENLEQPGSDSREVFFHLEPSFVGANINQMVVVSYDVLRYGYTTHSQERTLRILGFQDPENELPQPRVIEAVENVLDLMTFDGNATVTVATWPFIAFKQRVWLRLNGKTGSGVNHRITLLDGVETSMGQVNSGLSETLLRTELMKLGHSTPATVECRVAFSGDSQESAAEQFPALALTIRTRYDYVTPVITNVIDNQGDVAEGGKTRDPEITIKGTATRGETVELFDGLTASKGTALVEPDNTWTRKITGLIEKPYSITAKALYDANPVSSDPRTFTVKFAETPEIASIIDSRGVVAPGAITYDSNVLVEGRATPNEKVELSGGSALVTLDVSDKGLWEHRLVNLTVKTYTLTAKALYEIDPELSPPRSFVVAQAVTPTISLVTDIRGIIDNGGTTYYKTVTLSGKASPDEQIELRDGNTPFNTVDVESDGTWNYEFGNLQLKLYSLTAKALYGEGPVSTPARTFTAAAHISPTIEKVTDTIGNVAPGGITYDNSVTMEGNATPLEEVEISHNPGEKVPVLKDGKWTARVAGLSVRSYSIKAKALYVVDPVESGPRAFEVRAHTPVKLNSVRDNTAEIPQNGQTISTTVHLKGEVTPLHSVQIHDNGSPKHTVAALQDGTWTTSLAVTFGNHSLTAKAVATGQESSPARTFNVRSELIVDPSDLILNGQLIMIPGAVVVRWPAGTSKTKPVSGGMPPYIYSSSNTGVAIVDRNTGLVSSISNGTTTITVQDTTGTSKSFRAVVSNVLTGRMHWLHNITEAGQKGRVLNIAELETVRYTFNTTHNSFWGGGNTGASNYWSGDWAGGSYWRTLHLFNGTGPDTAISYIRMMAIVV